MVHRAASLLILFCLLLGFNAAAAQDESAVSQTWTSAKGVFRVSYTSALKPITINRIHHWILHVENAEGDPVSDAEIKVQGGMPAHDHGLPTSPRLTAAPGAGDYRLEGLRFHMPGYWEITLSIDTGVASDTVLIPLEL